MEGTQRFDVGAAIGRSFRTWAALIVPLTALNAAVMVPLALFLLFGPERPNLLMFGSTMWGLLGSLVVAGTSAFAVVKRLRGEPVSVGEAVGVGLRKLFPLLGMGIVIGLPVFGVVIVAVFAGLASPFAMIGVFVLAAIPLVAYFIAHAISGPALVVENLGIMAAMERSRSLTRGRRWAVFGTLLVIGLLSGVAQAIVELPFGFKDPQTIEELRTKLLASLAFSTVLGSLGGVCNAVVYRDLRSEKDGVAEDDLLKTFG